MLVNQEQDNNITKKPVKEIKAAHKFLKKTTNDPKNI